MDFFSTIDQLAVNEIKPLVLLNVLGRMESRGATEQSREVRERCSEFRYAFVTSRTEYNPAADLTCQIKECQILRSVMFRIITAIVCLVLAFSVTAWIKPVNQFYLWSSSELFDVLRSNNLLKKDYEWGMDPASNIMLVIFIVVIAILLYLVLRLIKKIL